MKKLLLFGFLIVSSSLVQAKPAFTGQNYSGVYVCKGNNSYVGDYEVLVKLRLNRVSSHGNIGAYYYETETLNATTYSGRAIADGNRLALSYQITDNHNLEHNVGLATIRKIGKGRWAFQSQYYEPDDNGGNYGTENCLMQANPVLKK